jgi:hypothetical protein
MRGYFPMTIDSVAIMADQTIRRVDFDLTPCPIPLNLVASDTLDSSIEVDWDSLSYSGLIGFNVYRGKWEAGSFVKLTDAPIQGTHYSDTTLADSAIYWYYVTACFAAESGWTAESFPSDVDWGRIPGLVGVRNEPTMVPDRFFLSQNYPNPFNPATTISYGLPQDTDVRLDVYNIMGQKVRMLVDGWQAAGYKSIIWDGHDGSGRSVASGLYFCRIKTIDYQMTRKMLMVK